MTCPKCGCKLPWSQFLFVTKSSRKVCPECRAELRYAGMSAGGWTAFLFAMFGMVIVWNGLPLLGWPIALVAMIVATEQSKFAAWPDSPSPAPGATRPPLPNPEDRKPQP